MTETIRYAWGESSLGSFIAAASDGGLVAFEFAARGIASIDRLRSEQPGMRLIEAATDLAPMITRLTSTIEHPGEPAAVALDPRGTEYQQRVWQALRTIPAGETSSYGAIAKVVGTRDVREVTDAIVANRIAILIPCHRVLKKDGSLSGYRWGAGRKRALLQREGAVLGLFQDAAARSAIGATSRPSVSSSAPCR